MKLLSKFLTHLKQTFCRHQFNLKDLVKTRIPEPEKPQNPLSRKEWAKYWKNYYDGEWVEKSVKWHCSKCKKVFFGRNGLEISRRGNIV